MEARFDHTNAKLTVDVATNAYDDDLSAEDEFTSGKRRDAQFVRYSF